MTEPLSTTDRQVSAPKAAPQLCAQFMTLRADLDNPDSGHMSTNAAVGVCMSGFG